MSLRIIARLDVKPPYVVKPVHFEGLTKNEHPSGSSIEILQSGCG